jgi:hypothetical protein
MMCMVLPVGCLFLGCKSRDEDEEAGYEFDHGLDHEFYHEFDHG